jgi:hypothetical protein
MNGQTECAVWLGEKFSQGEALQKLLLRNEIPPMDDLSPQMPCGSLHRRQGNPEEVPSQSEKRDFGAPDIVAFLGWDS